MSYELAALRAISHRAFRASQTASYHFRHWRLKGSWYRIFTALRGAERERVGGMQSPAQQSWTRHLREDG